MANNCSPNCECKTGMESPYTYDDYNDDSGIERGLFYALRDLLRIHDMPQEDLDTYPEGLLTEIADEAWEQARGAVKEAAKRGVRRI